MEKSTLNGFEAILDTFIPNVGNKRTEEEPVEKVDDIAVEELTDEELEEIAKQNKTVEKVDDEEEEDEPVKKETKKAKKAEEVEQESEETETGVEVEETEEGEMVTNFFNAMAEKMGWELEENEEVPQTAEELIEYFQDIIEENSTPDYASEEIQKLDEFVKNGGDIKDYFTIDAELDVDDITIEDEYNQKLVVKEFLKEKGFNSKQIEKKISKYEDAGLLEDEAEDALEALKEIKVQKKEQLLTKQRKAAEEAQNRQQEFFANVVNEIKGMNSIHGVNIPEKDKKELLDFIFKPDANGMTKYQKEYAKSLKNLITSAYFTMKGDTLVDIAKKEGKKTAINNFKNSLTKNSGISKQSRKQTIKTNDDLWSSFTRQLRVS